MANKTVLIICYSDLNRDPRVLRQIDTLSPTFNIIAAGLSSPNLPNLEFIKLYLRKRSFIEKVFKLYLIITRKYEQLYWTLEKKKDLFNLSKMKYDLVIANDLEALPLGLKVAKSSNSKLIFDAHEYYPDFTQNQSFKNKLKIKEIKYQCNKYLLQANFVTTVSEGISNKYFSEFGIQCSIIRNSVKYISQIPSKVDPANIKLVHHGGALPGRKLELMIESMKYLDSRFSLYFYLLVPDEFIEYYNYLKSLSQKVSPNIHFKQIVPTKQIPFELNQYDLGIYILPPRNFNSENALPNKFFEYVQGRLGIAIGPSKEMSKYVNRYELGVISEDFSAKSFADKINKLEAEQIQTFKFNAHECAKLLSSETEEAMLNEIVKTNII